MKKAFFGEFLVFQSFFITIKDSLVIVRYYG